MFTISNRRLHLIVALWSITLFAGCGRRGEYPQRPIVLVCPWSAGGGTDRCSRQVAALLEQEIGIPVNVVNATGGAGVTGHTRGALARPDGYTITMITVELNMLHWRGLTNISYEDYHPVILLNRDDSAIFVRTDSPWKSIHELEQTIRDRPGEIKCSGTAYGGIWHVALAGWLNARGISPDDVVWVSINGSAPSLQELLAGGVDVVCCSVPEAQTLLDAGRVHCLGVMADARLPSAPDTPTFPEMGIDWTMGGWRGIALPRGVSPDRIEQLQQAMQRVAQSDEFEAFMNSAGFNISIAGPEQFEHLMAEMDGKFGKIFKSPAFRSVHRQQIGPMFFPALLACLGLGVLATLALSGWLKRPDDVTPLTRDGLARAMLAPVWVLGYLVLAEPVGFVVTATLLTAAMMWRLGVRPLVVVFVPLVAVPLTYQLFAIYLRVPLPWGILGW